MKKMKRIGPSKSPCKFHADDGEESLQHAVDLELDEYRSVQRDEQLHELGRHAVPEQHLPQEFSRHAIESFDEVDEEDPRLQAVFAALREELPHGEDRVRAAAPAAEAALSLVVELLHDRLEPRVQQVGHDLVGHLEHHDASVVARLAEVALFGQDGEQPSLPFSRHVARLPEAEHHRADDVEAGVRRGERLEELRRHARVAGRRVVEAAHGTSDLFVCRRMVEVGDRVTRRQRVEHRRVEGRGAAVELLEVRGEDARVLLGRRRPRAVGLLHLGLRGAWRRVEASP